MTQICRYLDRGVPVLLGGIFQFLFMGSIFIYGSIKIYVQSYLRLKNNLTSESQLLFLVIPLQVVMMSIFLPVGVYMNHHISVKITAAIGTILTLVCFFFSSFAESALAFVILFGGSHGIGNGLSFLTPVTAGWQYYPTRKGLISGTIICVFGFSAFIFTLVSNKLINPNNEVATIQEHEGEVTRYYFKAEIANRFPAAMRWLCLIWTFFVALTILLLRSPSYERKREILSKYQRRQFSSRKSLTQALVTPSAKRTEKYRKKLYQIISPEADAHQFTYREILATREFWILFTMSYFSIFFGFFMASAFKEYGRMTIKDDKFLSYVGAVGFVTNGFFRLLLSTLLDCFDFKTVYGTTLIMQIIICLTYNLVASNEVAFMFYTCISISFQGAHFAMFPTVCGHIYGARSGTSAFALVGSAFGLSTLTGFFVNKYLLPIIGYEILFFICAGFCAFSLCILILCFHPVAHAHSKYEIKQEKNKEMPGSIAKEHATYTKSEEDPEFEEEQYDDHDPAQQASELAYMKYGKPKKTPLIKGHAKKWFDSAEYFKQKYLQDQKASTSLHK